MVLQKAILKFIFLLLILTNSGISQEIQPDNEQLKTLANIDTTIWKYLSATDRSQWTITQADSEKALKDYFVHGAKIFRDVTNIYNKIGKGRLSLEQEASNLISLLEQVKEYFEEGLRINPFDNYIRTGITATYSRLEQLYAYKKEPVKRLQILKNLLCIKKEQKDRLYFYNHIGTIYRSFEIWEQARDNFQLAVETIFEGDESSIDTTKLFENIYLRGEAQLKLYQDEPALTSFTYARMIAPNENTYNSLTSLIDFINWDNGNIRASEKYRDARNLYSKRKFDEAESVYLDLLKIIKTEKARNQAQLDLARTQFNYLNKKEEAIERLWKVVNKYSLDPMTGVPIDSTKKNLWEIYSQMCLQMGIHYFNIDKRSSFAYFLKSSQIESNACGKAFLNLAIMSIYNPLVCLDFCTHALEFQEQLNTEEKKLLYDTLYKSYLKQGDFEEALRWYKKYHEI